MKRLLLFCLWTTSLTAIAAGREWFVRQTAGNASDTAGGSVEHPLRTINAAAQLAQPGDTITVGPGIYHEWVSPARAGSPSAPILYRSVPEHTALVRGTDVLRSSWQPVPDAPGVFCAALPLAAFAFGNPFVRPPEPSSKKKPNERGKCHALVYCQDQPLTQVTTHEELCQHPGSWLANDDGQQLFVHLRGNTAPGAGTVEVTTRDRIFAPHRRGLNYIQVDGFVFERCATRPGFPQLGALSTRTGQYWVIRNNIVRDTTGRGIDCGSETWDPASLIDTETQDRHVLIGGHHLVAGNLVTDNAEGGIAAWNTDYVRIVGNIVRDNCTSALGSEHSLTDFEAGGIKVHAFRNGLIEGNLVVSNSAFGIWLDNGWENARVTRNVCLGNHGAGIFVELGFGPILVDHNLSAANVLLDPPYLGDGIYTHDASGVTITHNTFVDNAHFGVEQIVVTERVYGPKHMAEASHETLTGNLFYGNRVGAVFLPLLSPRSHDNVSDWNAIQPGASFSINNNEGRIPLEMVLRECRDRLGVAEMPKSQWPDLSHPKQFPMLSLAAWQAVMLLDQNTTPLPATVRFSLDPHQYLLQVDLPTPEAIPAAPPGPADDFDLLGAPCHRGRVRAGAIEELHAGTQTLKFWPLLEKGSVNTASPNPGS